MPVNLYGTDFYENILYVFHFLNDIYGASLNKYFPV
jgi:hypothetical protein